MYADCEMPLSLASNEHPFMLFWKCYDEHIPTNIHGAMVGNALNASFLIDPDFWKKSFVLKEMHCLISFVKVFSSKPRKL